MYKLIRIQFQTTANDLKTHDVATRKSQTETLNFPLINQVPRKT